ncbi:MAG: hypothetical protein H6671_08085 [Anaerolineaceae bacterium]|nr:hypothetical protein [Anaerolineaceae bacterium]
MPHIGEMVASVVGKSHQSGEISLSVVLDAYVVMPNHFHGIIIINRYAPSVGAAQRGRPEEPVSPESTRAGTPARPYTLSDIMGWFKTMTTNAYIRGVDEHGWESFPGKLWQRSFHDRIIRDEREWDALRGYILTNPARWAEDRFYGEA